MENRMVEEQTTLNGTKIEKSGSNWIEKKN